MVVVVLKKIKESDIYRHAEIGFVLLFVILTLVVILLNPTKAPAEIVLQEEVTGQVIAQANGMPNQGWTPLTVYFSGFGSRSTDGEIIRYEWDLDANGLYDTNGTPDSGYVSYTYNKPGEYLVTLRVMDEQGNTATDTILIIVRHPASSPVDYWKVFDDSKVRRVTFKLSKDNWDLMWSDPEAKIVVPADAFVFGEELQNVGVRMRGQFSLRESGQKKPWKIDTDAYVDGQEYYNLKQLMFINNIGDHTMLREKLAYEMMYFAGVPSSFVSYVEIWFDFTGDGQSPYYWGVYTMVERIDRKYLASRFGRDNRHGNLYKASHAQRGPMDLIYYGPSITDYPTQNGQYAYGKMTNEEENDYSDVIQLAYVLDGVEYDSQEEFKAALEEIFNVDGFLRYMAVMVTLGGWDYYPYTGNNFYLYNNPGTGKFEWLPWDLTWGDNIQMPLFEREGFGIIERAPAYDKVFKVEDYRYKFAAYVDLLVRYWFNYENVSVRAQELHNMIAPYVSQSTGDKMYYDESAWFTQEHFDDSWTQLAEYARNRSAFILATLSKNDWQSPSEE
jgi:hypothetical protein